MASTPKPVRTAIKGLVKEGQKRAIKNTDISHYSKSHEKKVSKKQFGRLKEAHKKGTPVINEAGKHVKKMIKKNKKSRY